MLFLIGTINLLIIAGIISYLRRGTLSSPIKPYFIPALILKLMAGVAVGLIYKYHYPGGDTFNYFHDASVLADLAFHEPWLYLKSLFESNYGSDMALIYEEQPRALLMSKIVSVVAILTAKNYWISGCYFSLFSFFGMWKIAEFLEKSFPSPRHLAACAFLFFPSMVFWSSGILKESIAMGCIGYLLVVFLSIYLKKPVSYREILLFIVFAIVLWEIKFYYAAVLLPLLFLGIVMTFIKTHFIIVRKHIVMQGFLVLSLAILSFSLVSFLHPSIHFQNLLDQIVKNHDLYFSVYTSSYENKIHYQDLQPEIGSVLKNFPLAVFSGLFRPIVFDAHSFFQFIVAIENTLLLILAFPALWQLTKIKNKYTFLLWLTFFYIIFLAAVMAFVAPNFGTLARYKLGFLPIFIYLIFYGNLLNLQARNWI